MNVPIIYKYYILLPHCTEARLLLMCTEKGWSLPHSETIELNFWQSCEYINLMTHTLLKINVITMRCLAINMEAQTRVYELENRDVNWTPPVQTAWMSQDDLNGLQLAQPSHRDLMDKWFAEHKQGIPLQRRAWARVGWFDETTRWIAERLQALDIQIVGDAKQVRTWERSCLLRVPTDLGPVYCKAVPAIFAHELTLTQSLGVRYPTHMPSILASDHVRRLLLMRDFGGPSLDELERFEQWEQAVHIFASLQREMATHSAALVGVGCPYRPLVSLADDIKNLLADTNALFLNGQGLTATQIATLRSQLPQFLNLSQELRKHGIPDTLEHGDFSPANVALVEDTPLFYDWSDASVAYPFFSMWIFPEIMEIAFPTISDWRLRQQRVYLEAWAGVEEMEQLQRAFEIAQFLAPLHHASRYHRYILPYMEAKWEMELMIPYYLGVYV